MVTIAPGPDQIAGIEVANNNRRTMQMLKKGLQRRHMFRPELARFQKSSQGGCQFAVVIGQPFDGHSEPQISLYHAMKIGQMRQERVILLCPLQWSVAPPPA